MLAFRERGWHESWPLNTQQNGGAMLKFDNFTVTLTADKSFVWQLFAYGEASGYPAETNYATARRAFETLGNALAEYERRELHGESSVIEVEFKRHG